MWQTERRYFKWETKKGGGEMGWERGDRGREIEREIWNGRLDILYISLRRRERYRETGAKERVFSKFEKAG